MPYATEQDLVDRYGSEELVRLTDRDGDGAVDTAVVQRALNDATALIDGYLLERYRLPLASTPDLLVALASQIAFYQLHPHGAPEEVRQGYKDAERTLSRIAKGEIALNAAGVEPAGVSGQAEAVGPARRFSRGSLEGF